MRYFIILLIILLPQLFCGCSLNTTAGEIGGLDTLHPSDTDSPVFENSLALREYEFDLTHPEPNGSTASMISYANEYLAFWEAEAELLVESFPEIAEEYEEYKTELNSRLSQLAEEYRDSPDAPYGTLAAPHIIMERAEAVRDFVISHTGK